MTNWLFVIAVSIPVNGPRRAKRQAATKYGFVLDGLLMDGIRGRLDTIQKRPSMVRKKFTKSKI
ncbi:MAG TPA: hypothetical protein DCR94_04980 [Firmicutes bacterium]|nr:hypothetical protein [Bacillota bacterium]